MSSLMSAVQASGDLSFPMIVFNPSVARPTPQNDEILIKVAAAGVTGDELLWPELYETPSRIPGHDISGVVSAMGSDYKGPLKIGDEVFALLAAERGEGQAQYAVCSANEVARKPVSISHIQAAALPIPLLTAMEAMISHGKVSSGMKILVTGASGAVGKLFVQLAARTAGADVTALASLQNHDTLKQLGAAKVVDYHDSNWQTHMTDIDVVFDTVGGDILSKSWETVKSRGMLITVADPPPPWAFERCIASESARYPNVTYRYFVVCPNAKRLEEASSMIDNGIIEAIAVKSFPIHDASHAWSFARQRGRGQKVVIEMGYREKTCIG